MSTVIFGAGGHAKVVLDVAIASGHKIDFLVTNSVEQETVLGHSVVSTNDPRWSDLRAFQFLVAVGDNRARARIFEELKARGGEPITFVHPFTAVSKHTQIGAGTTVCAGAVVNPATVIGENCIINTSASVDHDCIIGAHSHICPGVHLAGGVKVGVGTMIGTGAAVIPGITIGENCTIGAGSVVVRDIPSGSVAYGSPCRVQPASALRK